MYVYTCIHKLSGIAESKGMYMYAVLIETIKLLSKMNVPSYNSM